MVLMLDNKGFFFFYDEQTNVRVFNMSCVECTACRAILCVFAMRYMCVIRVLCYTGCPP